MRRNGGLSSPVNILLLSILTLQLMGVFYLTNYVTTQQQQQEQHGEPHHHSDSDTIPYSHASSLNQLKKNLKRKHPTHHVVGPNSLAVSTNEHNLAKRKKFHSGVAWPLSQGAVKRLQLRTTTTSQGVNNNNNNAGIVRKLTNFVDRITTPKAPSDVYIWMHIPKTSGSAGYKMFMQALKAKQRKTIFPPENFADWNSPGCMGKTIAYGGSHCSLSEITDCMHTQPMLPHVGNPVNATLHFATILRDPVERVLSEYFWWYRESHAAAWTPSMTQKRWDLKEWVLDEQNIAHNRQTLYMLLDVKFPQDLDECLNLMGTKLQQWIVTHYQSVSMLNNSTAVVPQHLLDQFEFVAVMEAMEDSRVAFQQIYGIEPSKPGKKEHVAKKKAVSEEIRQLIRDRNRLDYLLYELAKERLKAARESLNNKESS